MRHRKVKFGVGAFLIVSAIGYLITTSISSTSKFFMTVDELALAMDEYRGSGLKVKGTVVSGSINRDPNNQLERLSAAVGAYRSGTGPKPGRDRCQ